MISLAVTLGLIRKTQLNDSLGNSPFSFDPQYIPNFLSKIMCYKIGQIFFSQDPPFPGLKRRNDMR